MTFAEVVLLLSVAVGGGLFLAPAFLWVPDRNTSGKSVCFPPCVGMPVTILDQLRDMLGNPPGGMVYPLNRHWWTIKDCNYGANELKAQLEYVEDVAAIVRRMDMCWRIQPDPGSRNFLVEVSWRGIESPSTPVPCERIARTMQMLTEDLIQKLNATLTLRITASKVRSGLSSVVPAPHGPGKPVGDLDQQHSPKATGNRLKPAWPSPQDFNEAIQEPRVAFPDTQLQSGMPELNMMGMPKVASGAFASVYKLACPTRNWAIRCFLNPVRDQQYRYQQLSKYIKGEDLRCTVDFEYVSPGIRVGKECYPILRMEWVDGEQFHMFIEESIKRGHSLLPLLSKFRRMAELLHHAGVAHGDLQHGNIIIRDSELVLVDYDGMYVPSLSMEHSNELGHPNYQHPARGKNHFGPYLDNFSTQLIDTTLVALSLDPSLWCRFDGGDECLLLRRRDLNSPLQSETFKTLLEHPEREIRERSNHLLSLLSLDLEKIPALAADGSDLPLWKSARVGQLAAMNTAVPEWLADGSID